MSYHNSTSPNIDRTTPRPELRYDILPVNIPPLHFPSFVLPLLCSDCHKRSLLPLSPFPASWHSTRLSALPWTIVSPLIALLLCDTSSYDVHHSLCYHR